MVLSPNVKLNYLNNMYCHSEYNQNENIGVSAVPVVSTIGKLIYDIFYRNQYCTVILNAKSKLLEVFV